MGLSIDDIQGAQRVNSRLGIYRFGEWSGERIEPARQLDPRGQYANPERNRRGRPEAGGEKETVEIPGSERAT
jgi:hypothetical protein